MWSSLHHNETEVKEFKCEACGWKTANLQILHSHLLGHKEGLNYMHHHVDAKSFPVSNMVCSATQTETIHLVDNASQTDESSFETSTLKLPGHDESSFETSTLKLPGRDAVSCQTVKVEFDSSGLYDDGGTFFSNYEGEDSLGETEVKTEVFTNSSTAESADTITTATASKEAERHNEIVTIRKHGAKGRFLSAKPARKRTKKNLFVKKETSADICEDTDDSSLVSWLEAKSSKNRTKKNVSVKKEITTTDTDVIEDSDGVSCESWVETGLESDTKLEEDEVTQTRKKIAKPKVPKHDKSTAKRVYVPKTVIVTYEPPKQMLHCHLCHFQSSARKFMWHHIESQHAGRYLWKCVFCRIPFVAEGDYLHHIKQCKDSWVKCHTCSECNHQRVFISKKLLLEHLKQSHDNVFPLSCSVCKAPIASEFDEREHMSEHNREILKCRFCETVSKSVVESDIHMMSHVRDNPFTCYICDREFSRLQSLKNHIYTHLDDDDEGGSFVCEMCGVSFAHSWTRYRHSLECKKPFECKTCGLRFAKRGRMIAHESIVHDKIKKFICDQCGKAHAYKKSLLIHIARVHNSASASQYSCPVCGMVVYCRTVFERHMLIHEENSLLYACEYCDKKFRSKWNLTAHTRQHTGGKPYVCTKCGLAFTHNVSRKNHEAKCNNAS